MNRVPTFCVLFLLMLVTLTSCKTNLSSGEPDSEYLSLTVIYVASYDETKDYAEYGAAVCEYDLQTKEISEVYKFPLNAGYALGVYDKKTNSVFYSKEKDNDTYTRIRTGDQIYVYDLATGSDTMLTNDLLAINYIEPVDGAVFFIAARQGNDDSLALGKIDLSDGSIEYWDGADTDSVNTMSVDRTNKRIYVSVYDWEERDVAAAIGNDTNTAAIPPKHTIYSYDYNLSDKHEILRKDNMIIRSVYVRDNWLLYRADSALTWWPDTTISTISEIIDVSTMEVLLQSEEEFNIVGCFAPDKKGVYMRDYGEEYFDIFYYDFETRKCTSIGDFGNVGTFQPMY